MKKFLIGFTLISSLGTFASDSFISENGQAIIQNEAAQEIYEMLERTGAMRNNDVRALSRGDELRETTIYSPNLKFSCVKAIQYSSSTDSESDPHFSCSL